ncbi:hypothetical protein [Treponema brennaborense]|uniref:Uncharacterized protein n=1 Tax=Treponema brennaborense (strain DSM 12168 / CIP 105900 / DD5/3) TaxID=906968 RepID=F4LNY5_TREBD|nr:hypothetical protein [Treponema brennaborense]AEE17962.1 hypothetical protein Trebr_2558 [Treponema brennaborense DSM 12168]
MDLSAVTFVAAAETGSDTDGSDGSVAKVTVGGTDSVIRYDSIPTGIQLILSNGSSSGSYNKINTAQSAKGEGSVGAVEPSKADMVYAELAGPFTAKMFYAANSSTDKSDRTAQITVNGTTTFGPENSVPVAGAWLEASYTGTDTVKVYFGGTNVVRIHDISITK